MSSTAGTVIQARAASEDIVQDDLLKRTQDSLTATRARCRAIEEALANDDTPPRVGDVYRAPFPLAVPVCWVVSDVRGEVCELAPADDHPHVGAHDVEVVDEPLCEPMTLRGGRVVAVPRARLAGFRRVGRVREERLTMARRATGDPVDSDAAEWLERVDEAREQLRRRATSRVVEIRAGEHRTSPSPKLRLAAAPGGLAGAVAAALVAGAEAARGAIAIPCEPAGALLAVPREDGVVLVFTAPSAEPPEVAGVGGGGRLLSATWVRSPDGSASRTREVFPWIDGRAILHVASGEGFEVTVRREP